MARVGVLVSDSRDHLWKLGPIPEEFLPHLRGKGHHVDLIFGEDGVLDIANLDVRYDCIVLKGHDDYSLSLAGAYALRGVKVVNPYLSCVCAENKIISINLLRRAGVPVPDTWLTADHKCLEPLLDSQTLVAKPHVGGMGRNERIAMLDTREKLSGLDLKNSLYIVQGYVDGPGYDLKVYVVGKLVFGVKKAFEPYNFDLKGDASEISYFVKDVAIRVGKALGLGLYGIDVIESESGPVVVDVNYFPSYTGVREAPAAIAEYIHQYIRGDVSLDPPLI